MGKRKSSKNQDKVIDMYEDSDDTFAFIAGYTDGGAPFGTTWEELGLEPYASPEEIEKAYDNLEYKRIENQFEDFHDEDDYLAITERLLMRYMEENDFDDYLKVLKDIMPKAMQKGELKQYFIQGAKESYKDMFQCNQLSIGIWNRNNLDFCGYCILKHIDTKTPEIGIDLRKKYRRKHIGLESLTEILTFAKDNYEVDHFIYAVDLENVASKKLAERLGGIRKEIRNTLPENIVKLMNEVQEQDNAEIFRHYEYWIF
ncbi:MAG TPA: GNAT family N-acetyltransferase [Candidatus Merdenecus merdavium]|nr:GNAT family N-acetyltransferase [Candidatus Merdenecus merdavium]